jgi:hypothetical protein
MFPLLWDVTSFRLMSLFQITWLHIPENWNFRYSHVIMLVCNAVAQLVLALLYKPEGCGFDSRWYRWHFLST